MNDFTDEIQTYQLENWVLKVREPGGPGPHPVIYLLHGWTGDETVMWVFARRLPQAALMIAPRGLFPAPGGGYAWHPPVADGARAALEDFQPAVDALVDLQEKLAYGVPGLLSADYRRASLVGFSQGAALSFTFGLAHPERVERLAGLSGFLPQGAEALVEAQPLQGKRVFVAHGSQDRTVPVERARQAVDLLQSAGAQVTYCEEDVGHKLSAGCFRSLEAYFK